MSQMRQIVSTPNAPAAIGPYSQAVVIDNLIFCSGQIPLDPATGAFVGTGDVRAQTRRVMDNLRAVLEAAGSNLNFAAKATIFLKNLTDFAAVNEVYAEYFAGMQPPARATVEVAGLPRGALVEIEMIARLALS